VGLKPSARQGEARLRGLTHAVGLKPSARQDDARLRGLAHAVGRKPSARQDDARLRGLTHAIGRKPSARQDEARLRGLDKDYKPSLSAGKPRRGYGVESWVRGRPRPHARRRRAHPFE